MEKSSFSVSEKASISLLSLVERHERRVPSAMSARVTAFARGGAEISDGDNVAALLEVDNPERLLRDRPDGFPDDALLPLAENFVSAHLPPTVLAALIDHPAVDRVQTKKLKLPTLDHARVDIALQPRANATRVVPETGASVLVGIVDSGFDLTHPMFQASDGTLRVERLLDQTAPREFSRAQLASALQSGATPGADEQGHGTHVASIAAGSAFNGFEGVAPEATFLLVKTDFMNTDAAVSWIFQQAGNRPCVINMSLGHHFGPHDGTDAEERLHVQLTAQPGRAIVIAAGNERTDSIHIGGRFHPGQTEEVLFDILRPRDGSLPFAALTLWYDLRDSFDITLLSPSGQQMPLPAIGRADRFRSASVDIQVARKRYPLGSAIQGQIEINISNRAVRPIDLRGWKLRITAGATVTIGRFDAWINNSGFAEFRAHALVEMARTIGLPATGAGALAVASHVSRNEWDADAGHETDIRAVLGRSSVFSSLGPTRDGRQKPDFSAPGQYLTAALADGSELASLDDRALTPSRLLTIEGTSMATPIVTGVVALMFQRRPTATLLDIGDILRRTARHDAHTGPAGWNPTYGFGKIDVAAALNALGT
jgi:subtilisin family serine protease